jgi:hypothetical protein
MMREVTVSDFPSANEKIHVPLTEEERYMLDRGLVEWGGPARCTKELAVAMGFTDVDDLIRGEGRRILHDLRAQVPLTPLDWTRALLATEIVFASNVLGAGTDWPISTGIPDGEAVALLRTLQDKIGKARAMTVVGIRPTNRSGSRQTP